MSHELTYDAALDCVVLRIRGKVTVERIRELAPQVANMLEKTKCKRVLNDMRAAVICVPLLDIYRNPDIMDASKIMRNTRRALVVPPGFEDAAFLETVTRNRGHELMVFTDVDQAREWLLCL